QRERARNARRERPSLVGPSDRGATKQSGMRARSNINESRFRGTSPHYSRRRRAKPADRREGLRASPERAPQRVGTREEPREEIRAMLPTRCGLQPTALVNNAGSYVGT